MRNRFLNNSFDINDWLLIRKCNMIFADMQIDRGFFWGIQCIGLIIFNCIYLIICNLPCRDVPRRVSNRRVTNRWVSNRRVSYRWVIPNGIFYTNGFPNGRNPFVFISIFLSWETRRGTSLQRVWRETKIAEHYSIGFIILSIKSISSCVKLYFLYSCRSMSDMGLFQLMSLFEVKS